MTTYTAIPDTDIDPESPITTGLMTKLRNNPIAITEGASGAPKMQTDGYTDLSVTEAKLANGSVTAAKFGSSLIAQANLKTTTGEVSSTVSNSFLLPGGEYGFYPNFKQTSGTNDWDFMMVGNGTFTITPSEDVTSTYKAYISLNENSGSVTGYARQRYVQASPPYDLGDGQVPMFVYVMIDNLTGEVISSWSAEDPPWVNNGPSRIRAELYRDGKSYMMRRPIIESAVAKADLLTGKVTMFDYMEARRAVAPEMVEITTEMKNLDMAVIPTPMSNVLSGRSVVLLDPPATLDLMDLNATGESVADLLHGGYLQIGSVLDRRATPPGIQAVGWSWKNTK